MSSSDDRDSSNRDSSNRDSSNRDSSTNPDPPDQETTTGGDDADGNDTSRSDTSRSDTSRGNTSRSNTSHRGSADDPAGLGPKGPRPQNPLTEEEWGRLRAPFSHEAYVADARAIGRGPGHFEGTGDPHTSVIDLRLPAEVIRDRLDWVLGPGRYSYRFEPGPQAGGRRSVFCHLRIGGAARTGTGTYSKLWAAQRIALADAAVAFGIGASGRAAGPVAAEKERRTVVPDPVLEALEEQARPSPWTPEEGA